MNSDRRQYRLAPEQRLRTTREIEAVRREGVAQEGGLFRIQVWTKSGLAAAPPLRRVAVIASRRVGGAVARNRCKRLLRELFRLHQGCLPPHCDLVLVARRGLLGAPFARSEAAFVQAVGRLARRAPAGSAATRTEEAR